MSSWFVLAVSAAYIAFLFGIAWLGDRTAPAAPHPGSHPASPPAAPGQPGRLLDRAPVLYALSLGVYCTSWTFYGAVGRAATDGWGFLPIYVGPILVFVLGWPILAKMVRVAKAENVVSISDFLAARYGKSQALAALVTVTAVVGVMPYVALQLKAITISFEALTGEGGGALARSLPGGTTLMTAVTMALFAILFGIRTIHANEHHRGLMMAIAAESVVKLGAALAVGFGISAVLGGGYDGLAAAVAADPRLSDLLLPDLSRPGWWTATLLAALAIVCLPRQFHVMAVENTHPGDVRTATWLFPAYLVAINVFVLPAALAGLVRFGSAEHADTFLISIPVAAGWDWLALVAFVGGLSAATSMIIVEVVTLSTMVCNDVVVPLLLARRPAHDRAGPVSNLLTIRRAAVFLILALGYLYHRLIGSAYPLATIGLVSFAAVAQFGPALLGGLFWRRATRAGAFAGISAGFAGWALTSLLPSFAEAGWIGPLPPAPGPPGLDPLTSSVLLSLGTNLAVFVGVSLLTRQSGLERQQAERFVDPRRASEAEPPPSRFATLADLRELAARYVGEERANAAFREIIAARGRGPGGFAGALLARSDAGALRATERLLSGAIGTASARVVVASLLADRRLSRSDARSIIDEASKALLSQHELLRTTLENVGQGICVFDRDLRVATWNRRFLELLDVPEGFVSVGTELAEIVRFLRERGEYGPRGEIPDLLARRSDEGIAGRPDVYERRRPDGRVLEIATNPMPDGGFVAVYTDVTERHRNATALREANEGLERRIAERTRALAAAKAEAERANQGKSRFLAAASHDLLQPLHAARLFLSALSERSGARAGRAADPLVAQADASLGSVEQLLGDLLDVSKLDTGVVRPSPAAFRVEEVLGPLAEEFGVLAREHGLELKVARSSAATHSDPVLLRRIVQNLLANAVRYTARGRVLLGCRRRGGVLSIEVWDTGPGIPEDRLAEVFVEFRQLQRPGDERGRGLGLGLAIVERLATILGHRIRVRSEVGKGSCFAIEVPLVRAVETPRPRAPRSRSRNLAGALVLCIENEASILAASRALLSGWSCEVVAAATPEAALEELAGRVPDCALTDYHLEHGRTGIEALARVQDALGAFVPAAIVTADRSEAVRAAAAEAGMPVAYKPIRPGALRALVAELLAERRRRAAAG
jgi:Na+/proline symporter/CheY-like chemotaxis protein/anti-sigma regulatory factor (Ser/Thr protein kinase)